MSRPITEVVAGVLIQPDGRFLLASRPEGKAMAGYWEFPGGKIEPGELAFHALQRELHEELGIQIRAAQPWVSQTFDYAHAAVRLRFYFVTAWEGTLRAREGQTLAWQTYAHAPDVSPILPANATLLNWLRLPRTLIAQTGTLCSEAGVLHFSRPPNPQATGCWLDTHWSAQARPPANWVIVEGAPADLHAAAAWGADGLIWSPTDLTQVASILSTALTPPGHTEPLPPAIPLWIRLSARATPPQLQAWQHAGISGVIYG